MALDDAHPEQTWEVSHIGGDRFAGQPGRAAGGPLLRAARPAGGRSPSRARTSPASSTSTTCAAGRRTRWPVQAAELHLRRRVGATRIDDVALVRRTVDGDVTAATFAVAGATYDVRVRTAPRPGDRHAADVQGPPGQPGPAARAAVGPADVGAPRAMSSVRRRRSTGHGHRDRRHRHHPRRLRRRRRTEPRAPVRGPRRRAGCTAGCSTTARRTRPRWRRSSTPGPS